MEKLSELALSATITGTVASLVSTVALATLAKTEGKSALQPTNATSHWLHGDEAAARTGADMSRTAVGYATHHASAVFWAFPFEAYLAANPPKSTIELLGNAAAMSAVAAVVDYGMTPKRLTPGWEHVLSKPSMVAAFVSLAAGLAVGAAVSRQVRNQL